MEAETPAGAETKRPPGMSGPAVYQVRVQGCLDERWSDWFAGMALARDVAHDTTTLTGVLPDQAALHGVLARIRDLGLPLLSLACLETQEAGEF